MELRHYVSILRRWWLLLTILAVVGGGVALATMFLGQPTYESSTTILINQAPGALPNADAVLSGQRVASTYAELLHQRPVLQEVVKNLGLTIDIDELEKQITVTPVRDTNLLVLAVRDTNPQQAASIANEIVKVFIEQNLNFQASRYVASLESLQSEMAAIQRNIDRTEASLNTLENSAAPDAQAQATQLQAVLTQQHTNYGNLLTKYEEVQLAQAQTTDKISVVEEALPGKPTQSIIVVAILGVIVGLFVGFGAALGIETLRGSIRTIEELEEVSGVPTLGIIGKRSNKKSDDSLITISEPRSPISEAYRVLHTNIGLTGVDHHLNKLLISSSNPGEGKSTTAANLAIAMAQSGNKVLLVDADLRRPTLHRLFQRENSRGLTTALFAENGRKLLENVIATDIENLALLPSGPLPPNPAELLGSQRMAELVTSLSSHCDMVIFDSPPILALADSTLLMRLCDAVVLVVLAEVTRADTLARVRNHIVQSGAHISGTVFNRISASSEGYNYSYRKYYGNDKQA